MPYVKTDLKPGVNTTATQLQGQGGWYASNLIRFRDGHLEKWLGWTRLSEDPVSGTARTMHAFQDLDLIKYLAVGTNETLELWDDSVATIQDITPIRETANLTTPFNTTVGSATIGVYDVGHGATEGDQILIPIQAALGAANLIIYGVYEVTNVVDADNYEITAADTADATVGAAGAGGAGATPSFATTLGSDIVTVTLVAHGYSVGQAFPIPVSVSVGGLTLVNTYLVATTPTADTFTILASSLATSNDTVSENSGQVRIYYRISPGRASTEALIGWGTGGYGLGPYGTGSGNYIEALRIWSLDNFGELLLANVSQGALYLWSPPKAEFNFATLVATAPSINQGMFVAMPQAQVIIFGAETGGAQDPLLLRWSDTGSYSDYTATVTNQAGSIRLSRGSRIVSGVQGPSAAYIWTDTDIWTMQYAGPPFIYSVQIIGSGCGLISQHGFGLMGQQLYWMSEQGFWRLGASSVEPLRCSVWDTVFADLDKGNQDKIITATNAEIGEVMWFYPSLSGGTGEIDSYVKFNVKDEVWDYGRLVRTAWLDHGLLTHPTAVDGSGYILNHEDGYDNNTAAMADVSATSAYSDLQEGGEMVFVDQVIPDFVWRGTSPEVLLTVYTTDWPGSTPLTHGPYTLNETTTAVTLRARARQIAYKVEMDGIDMWFRLGAVRVRVAPAGRVGFTP